MKRLVTSITVLIIVINFNSTISAQSVYFKKKPTIEPIQSFLVSTNYIKHNKNTYSPSNGSGYGLAKSQDLSIVTNDSMVLFPDKAIMPKHIVSYSLEEFNGSFFIVKEKSMNSYNGSPTTLDYIFWLDSTSYLEVALDNLKNKKYGEIKDTLIWAYYHTDKKIAKTLSSQTQAPVQLEGCVLQIKKYLAQSVEAKDKMYRKYLSDGLFNKSTLAIKDPAFEKAVKAKWQNFDDYTLTRLVICDQNWDISKDDYNQITMKTKTVVFVMTNKKDGKCYGKILQAGYSYMGGGSYDTEIQFWTFGNNKGGCFVWNQFKENSYSVCNGEIFSMDCLK